MRKQWEQRLNEIWYGGRPPPAWLQALVPVYNRAFRMHRAFWQSRQPQDLKQMPIIVIGNLTAGGTGKTPLVIRLCQLLDASGIRTGVASRGFGRTSGSLLKVSPASSPDDVGDEPLLIAQRTSAEVIVAANRAEAVRRLFRRGATVVIADDGLQHHRLPRALEICVVDGQREFGNGSLLPAGPLREPVSRLDSVDFVVVNGAEDSSSLPARHAAMQLSPGWLRQLDGRGPAWRLAQFSGCRVHAVAGIAHPQRFFRTLEHAGLKPVTHSFPDHHRFVPPDFAGLEAGLPIIMTEKDAVKCRDMNLDNAWYLSVDAVLPPWFESGFIAGVHELIAGSKR